MCLMSALIHGRPELMAQVNSYNLQDLTNVSDSMPAIIAKQADIPAVLSLTAQQLQDIANGSVLFSRLLQGIHNEQLQAQAECNSSSSSVDSSESGHPYNTLDSLHRDWEVRQNRTHHMQVLLRKEYAVHSAIAAWVVGCLSWQQYTSAAVAAWPSVHLHT